MDSASERTHRLTDEQELKSRRGVYGISVASELSGVAPQTLRLYEQRGLITPSRTEGGTRRYSDDDLARLQRITELLGAGVNVAGIGQILDLQDRNTQLQSDISALKSANVRLTSAHRGTGAPREDHVRERNDHDELDDTPPGDVPEADLIDQSPTVTPPAEDDASR
jgi:MerR family transcriptional regulator/heat shock protein HspR